MQDELGGTRPKRRRADIGEDQYGNWDPPDCPLPLPEPQKYDAASLVPTRPVDGAATRETVACPACLATSKSKYDEGAAVEVSRSLSYWSLHFSSKCRPFKRLNWNLS